MSLTLQVSPQMRKAGLMFKSSVPVADIAAHFNVATSTVYNWLDKQNIDPSANRDESQQDDTAPAPHVEATDLQQLFAQGFAKAQNDVFFRVICALYWGEGRLGDVNDLESTTEVSLASSDHTMINLWLKWLDTTDYANEKRIRIHVNRKSPMTSSAVQDFWGSKLKSPMQVEVVRVDSTTKVVTAKRKAGSAYVTVYNGQLRALLLGGISYLKKLANK